MNRIMLFVIIWGVGLACGFMLAALLTAKSDADDFEEGFRDGYRIGKNEILDNMDDLCSHCAYKGRME